MIRALLGALLAAIAMFFIGFILFATPLYKIGIANLDDQQAAAVQQAMAANMPRSGTYFVPEPDTRAQAEMYSRGPVATVHYNMRGFAPAEPGALAAGFVHFSIVALLATFALYLLSRRILDFGEQAKIAGAAILAFAVFARLGDPIWYHHDWTQAIYLFVADLVSLGAAALIILKLLPRSPVTEQAGATSELS